MVVWALTAYNQAEGVNYGGTATSSKLDNGAGHFVVTRNSGQAKVQQSHGRSSIIDIRKVGGQQSHAASEQKSGQQSASKGGPAERGTAVQDRIYSSTASVGQQSQG